MPQNRVLSTARTLNTHSIIGKFQRIFENNEHWVAEKLKQTRNISKNFQKVKAPIFCI